MRDLKYPNVEAFLVQADEAPPEMPEEAPADPTRWLEPFELTPKVEKFLKEYDLEGDIEKLGEDEEGEEKAKLTPKVAQDLANTDRLFKSGEYADERIEGMDEAIKKKILELGKKVAPKFEFEVEVNARDSHYGNPAHYWQVTLKKGDTEVERDILYYTYEPWINLAEGASSWNWAAWLGLEESPFFDDTFADAYDEDYVSIAWEEMFADFDRSQDKLDMEESIKELEKEYVPTFHYMIDLDERGSFKAHVEDEAGKIVYNLSNEEDGEEGELPEIRDGFMRHTTDIKGLEKHLKDMDIMPEKADLVRGNDR